MFWLCIFSLRCPACDAYVPYCHLWPVRLYIIFPHCLVNGPIVEKGYWTSIFRFDFLYKFCQTFLTVRRIEQDTVKNVYLSSCEVLFLFLSGCIELEFSRQIFEKCISNFMKIHPVGAELFHTDGETDRHDKANSRFSKLCERDYKWMETCIRIRIHGAQEKKL